METTKDKNKLKKRLIISLCIILGVILVMYLLTLLIPYIQDLFEADEEEYVADYSFYEPNYSEDIYSNEGYMALIADGMLVYDNASNSIVSLTPESAAAHGDAVVLLTDMMYSILNGNSSKYNECFSQRYFEDNEPKGSFTKQKIYNGTIKPWSAETVEEKNKTYIRYVYEVKYLIYQNDGTFRRDLGELYRTQYIVVTNREGDMLIDDIMYERTAK